MLAENRALLKEIGQIVGKSNSDIKFGNTDYTFKNYDEFFENKILVIILIRSGVSSTLFSLISNVTPFSLKEWAMFLDLSHKSLQRYQHKIDHLFKPIQSEKIVELVEVTYKGVDVFGSIEKFKTWLNTPYFAFGNNTPYSLLKDSYGKELVLSELVRIDHGILG